MDLVIVADQETPRQIEWTGFDLPARAGSPLAGRDSHPLDDVRNFKETSQFLLSQSTSRAWSHYSTYARNCFSTCCACAASGRASRSAARARRVRVMGGTPSRVAEGNSRLPFQPDSERTRASCGHSQENLAMKGRLLVEFSCEEADACDNPPQLWPWSHSAACAPARSGRGSRSRRSAVSDEMIRERDSRRENPQ